MGCQGLNSDEMGVAGVLAYSAKYAIMKKTGVYSNLVDKIVKKFENKKTFGSR